MSSVPNKVDDDSRALPTNRAFVLQFRQHADVKGGCVDGRIEHISSGQASLFHSLDDLVNFLEGIVSAKSSEKEERK